MARPPAPPSAGPGTPIALREANRLFRWCVCGVLSGILGASAVTVLRWATWAPYEPLLVPYDLITQVLLFGLCFGVLGLVARRSPRAATIGGVGLVIAGSTAFWLWQLDRVVPADDAHLFYRVATGLAALLVIRALLRRSEARGALLHLVTAVFLAVPVSLLAAQVWTPLLLLFPMTVVWVTWRGVPPQPVTGARSWLVPLVPAISLLAVCTSTLYPGSPQRLPAPRSVTSAPVHSAGNGTSMILIVLDTLRRDHVSLYGYPRKTTPNLDRWAADARVFDDARSNSSWTLPSHASLFTGLYPRSHGVHGYRGKQVTGNSYVLGDETTLAQRAADAGLATASLTANPIVGGAYGLDRGFETLWVARVRRGLQMPVVDRIARRRSRWQYSEFDWPYYRAQYMTDAAIHWLRQREERPFFLFLNYMDVHSPNVRPNSGEPWDRHTGDEAVSFDHWAVMAGNAAMPAWMQASLRDQYDRELVHLDRQLGRLFRYLEESGLAGNTHVVLTSDHGEYLGEHNLYYHGLHLHEPVIDVPLILKGPGIVAGRDPKPVQGVDLLPTALELLGLPPDPQCQGLSLLGPDASAQVSEWYPAHVQHTRSPDLRGRFDRGLRAIEAGHYKLFRDEAGRTALFDLARDPGEAENLVDQEPKRAEALCARLQEWLESHPPRRNPTPATPAMTSAMLHTLEALGYVK